MLVSPGRLAGPATRLANLADGNTCNIPCTARAVIRVENGAPGKPVYGMFFGTAAIVRAIDLCRRAFEERECDPRQRLR